MTYDAPTLRAALEALDVLLATRGEHHVFVVIGGAAMQLGNHGTRATSDVDVLGVPVDGNIEVAAPLPPGVVDAAAVVARTLGLEPGWFGDDRTKGVLEEGLPPGFVERMTEFRVGRALCFMIPAREDLITLKLDAASSNLAERAKHVSDLHDLAPTPAEWEAALRHVEARFISPADAAVRDARTIRADIEGTS